MQSAICKMQNTQPTGWTAEWATGATGKLTADQNVEKQLIYIEQCRGCDPRVRAEAENGHSYVMSLLIEKESERAVEQLTADQNTQNCLTYTE